MFCPKCGEKNPDTGKYCRSCGTDLGTVQSALSGDLSLGPADSRVAQAYDPDDDKVRRNDPHEVFADGVKNVISGFGFLFVSMALLFTGVAGGKAWWWAMLFPAFTFFAKGVADILKSNKMESRLPPSGGTSARQGQIEGASDRALPDAREHFVKPESRYKTGDLVPPSVTEGTTRHLEVNKEGETMALPKRDN